MNVIKVCTLFLAQCVNKQWKRQLSLMFQVIVSFIFWVCCLKNISDYSIQNAACTPQPHILKNLKIGLNLCFSAYSLGCYTEKPISFHENYLHCLVLLPVILYLRWDLILYTSIKIFLAINASITFQIHKPRMIYSFTLPKHIFKHFLKFLWFILWFVL